MRLIPVIDLLDGQTVHAIRGERQNYRPVKSVLCNTSDPTMIARAFRDVFGLNEIYIADLNSIQGSPAPCHRRLIAALAEDDKFDIMLDAGISEIEDAASWINLGVRKLAIGAETLREFGTLRAFPPALGSHRLAFSLDMRSGKILTCCPDLEKMSPREVLGCLESFGWAEVILLDLDRVGSEGGVEQSFVREAKSRFSSLDLLVGGGLGNPQQLVELRRMGISGVLAATALHSGIINVQHLSTMGEFQR